MVYPALVVGLRRASDCEMPLEWLVLNFISNLNYIQRLGINEHLFFLLHLFALSHDSLHCD